MTITTTQKIITIGSSKGITIPAKDLKTLGLDVGSHIKITAEPAKVPQKQAKIIDEYADFIAQYGQTLKNLSQR